MCPVKSAQGLRDACAVVTWMPCCIHVQIRPYLEDQHSCWILQQHSMQGQVSKLADDSMNTEEGDLALSNPQVALGWAASS